MEAMDAFGSVFGEAKPPPPERGPLLFHAYSHARSLRLLATDLHSLAWDRSLSLSDIDDLRDDVGIGGSCSDFLDYLKSAFSDGEVNLLSPSAHPSLGQECEVPCCKILRKMTKNNYFPYRQWNLKKSPSFQQKQHHHGLRANIVFVCYSAARIAIVWIEQEQELLLEDC
uniref:Uncharacterized protein n=1 Tax=Leersia perrieri TaxID=77586 RepID=A0A0D9WBM9_9ORYZ